MASRNNRFPEDIIVPNIISSSRTNMSRNIGFETIICFKMTGLGTTAFYSLEAEVDFDPHRRSKCSTENNSKPTWPVETTGSQRIS